MHNNLVIQLPNLNPEFVMQTMSEVYDWGLQDLNVPKLHKTTMGSGVKVGIVDSGLSEHFETEHAVKGYRNFTNEPETEDRNGHSTFIAGIIAAAKNNEGVVGVAPKCDLYFAKAMDNGGRGNPAAMVQAVHWLISEGVDIISISAGMFFDFKPLHKVVKMAYSKNIIIVAATGNTGKRHYDVAFPARYPEVIGVAAYDQRHQAAKFSSRGINVTCAMPGVDIYSTHLNHQFVKSNGTSYACPMLSGICALILSQHRKIENPKTPCETPQQMMEHLEKYAINLGDKKSVGFGTLDTEGLFSSED